ncbi:hypothetical protein [Nostoc sp. LEGE 12450]|uniref:hypothetical protein n=1 Tax=Nostoc sp. LEGE 12450 TaxID=1828643 RepID=UPI00187E1401|nr:hypothetical protein [Nostoc sp. LEGE 12450]MBE8988072.1 hypothetical protein [Nostoc sp. LEGE 12450]
MKSDRYIKIVLTVIAVALVFLTWENALEVKYANAAQGISKIAICDKSGKYCADVTPTVNANGEDAGVRLNTLVLQQRN